MTETTNRFGRTPAESEALRARVADMQRRYLSGELKDKSSELEAQISETRMKLRAQPESI